METNIKIKLSDILKDNHWQMTNGQATLSVPFLVALEKLARCPAQNHKTQYWAGRCAAVAKDYVESFHKFRAAKIELLGKPVEGKPGVFEIPSSDEVANKEFASLLTEELEREIEMPVNARFTLRDHIVAKGEEVSTIVDGMDCVYIKDLIVEPK